MANWDTPKSTGEKIGKVVAIKHNAICVELATDITLHNGDGICYQDKGFAINRIEGDWIFPNIQVSRIGNRVIGTTLYRNLDNDFLRSLRAERRMPVAIRFEAIAEGYRLTIGEKTAVFKAEHQTASNPERALQTIIQQLSKLGDTDFIATDILVLDHETPCSETFPYFLPTSQLNQWRREVIISHSPEGIQYPIAAPAASYSEASYSSHSERPIGGTPSYSPIKGVLLSCLLRSDNSLHFLLPTHQFLLAKIYQRFRLLSFSFICIHTQSFGLLQLTH
jgi:hypothetical protein